MSNKVVSIRSRVVPLPARDIDTDQIIPARFLKVTSKDGLADHLFADWRRDPGFILHSPEVEGAEILCAGDNFGCGSSREHAPWALRAWGFRAVISTSFADIFRNNALKNGLVPVAVPAAFRDRVLALREADPDLTVDIDIASQTALLPDGESAEFPLDGFARHCLLEGKGELGYLLSLSDRIREYEEARS
jgi:3-isopropylmalate/(R)-2-methylmalate dehydratase small subunit